MENKTVSSEDIVREIESLRKKNAAAISVRKSRVLGLICLVVTFVCVLLLLFPSSSEWEIYKPLWYVTIVAGSGSAVWLLSFPAVWILQWRLKRVANRGVKQEKPERKAKKARAELPKAEKVASGKPPFSLPVFLKRIRAAKTLKELREQSDYCFVNTGASYVRIVRLADGREEMRLLDKPVKCEVAFGERMCTIAIAKTTDASDRVGVQARWFPMDATKEEMQNAETVWLTPNVPAALCYSEIVRHPNGSSETVGHLAYTITWIGGGV